MRQVLDSSKSRQKALPLWTLLRFVSRYIPNIQISTLDCAFLPQLTFIHLLAGILPRYLKSSNISYIYYNMIIISDKYNYIIIGAEGWKAARGIIPYQTPKFSGYPQLISVVLDVFQDLGSQRPRPQNTFHITISKICGRGLPYKNPLITALCQIFVQVYRY